MLAMPLQVSFIFSAYALCITKQQCKLKYREKKDALLYNTAEREQTIQKFQGSNSCTDLSFAFIQNKISLVF